VVLGKKLNNVVVLYILNNLIYLNINLCILRLTESGPFLLGGERMCTIAAAIANETNARLADEQARDAVRRGAYDELKLRRQMSILQGEQRSALAASGVEVDTGSPGWWCLIFYWFTYTRSTHRLDSRHNNNSRSSIRQMILEIGMTMKGTGIQASIRA
jgi:hypothetical protein